LKLELPIGSVVHIEGLTSSEGKRLNGSRGVVVLHNRKPLRMCVDFASEAGQWIKPRNLILVDIMMPWDVINPGSPKLVKQTTNDMDDENLTVEEAGDTSLTVAPEPPADLNCQGRVNAQIHSALVKNSVHSRSLLVLLITFSRPSLDFRDALLEHERLAPYKRVLDERGLDWEHSSGAKFLVKPDQYNPLMEEIRQGKFKLALWHLFLDPPLQEAVDEVRNMVNAELPKKQKFYAKHIQTVPLNFAASILDMDLEATVHATLIDIHAPTRPMAEGSVVASTTDAAEGRKGRNHHRTLDDCFASNA
jgi:hypothetical protein